MLQVLVENLQRKEEAAKEQVGEASDGPIVSPDFGLSFSSGLEIVPWKTIRDVIALQIWPEIVQSRCITKSSAKETPATPVIILSGPSDSSPPSFEFQTGRISPAHQSLGAKRISLLWLSQHWYQQAV